MKRPALPCVIVALLTPLATLAAPPKKGLLEARAGFRTKIIKEIRDDTQLAAPPASLFSLVKYKTPLGEMAAYLGVSPSPAVTGEPATGKRQQKHPAMLWISGGFPPGGTDSSAWGNVDPDNDQSARAYRLEGFVMLYPTFRGANGNPGSQEFFFGEVDDVLAALAFLETVPYVDPERIYLGGHSTGGTLALLVAAATDKFRAVIAFGPSNDGVYGEEVPYDERDPEEVRLRSPIEHLASIRTPTLIVEGSDGNASSLESLKKASRNRLVQFVLVDGAGHFDILAPINRLLARRFANQPTAKLADLKASEVQESYKGFREALREVLDLEMIAAARRDGAPLDKPISIRFYLYDGGSSDLVKLSREAKTSGFLATTEEPELRRGRQGHYFQLVLTKQLTLGKLDEVFSNSRTLVALARKLDVTYWGWATK